ncbi:MAG TPA: ribosome biogenesis GTPase Der [Acidimicrobiales bacterium]|nr:ribosome biogenesis GTPase Der [Acidimicrobiales bacterium]
MGIPVVAVVGRPNVGKSTLVNRIIGRREAIVEEQPGVTRDRKVLDADWAGRAFTLVDTGGWLPGDRGLDGKVSRQAERAMGDAALILFVVDATVGPTSDDEQVAGLLRRLDRPVLVVANKVDSERREADIWDFVRFGLGDPWPVSALHGRGTGDLLDEVIGKLPDEDADAAAGTDDPETQAEDHVPAVAIVGRPNVGKSTLFNQLIGDERSIVHDLPGTTRDTIDTVIESPDGPLRFVDTAGMRRKSRIDEGTEYFSLVRALQAIDEADAAVLVIDASEGVTHQDQRLAERIDAAGSPIVIVLNKWDVVATEEREGILADVGDRLAFLGYAPVLRVSAKTRLGLHKLLPALGEAIDAYHRRIPTRELNDLIASAQAAHPPPDGRVLYATQGATDPPTFTLFTNRALPPTYLRYLEHRIRDHFGFGPTPLKLRVRRRGA